MQVGAFTSEAEAESRLGEVQGRASSVLDGHQPIAVVFQKDETQWYRAALCRLLAGWREKHLRPIEAHVLRMRGDARQLA